VNIFSSIFDLIVKCGHVVVLVFAAIGSFIKWVGQQAAMLVSGLVVVITGIFVVIYKFIQSIIEGIANAMATMTTDTTVYDLGNNMADSPYMGSVMNQSPAVQFFAYMFPFDFFALMLSLVLSVWIFALLYRAIKSWIPTVA